MRAALRKRQSELFDSGLLPEALRVRRAEENHLTIYEMVRDPKLYSLERYLDLSNLALSRDPKNLDAFVKALSDADEAIRYWGIYGFFCLKKTPGLPVTRSKRRCRTKLARSACWRPGRIANSQLNSRNLYTEDW